MTGTRPAAVLIFATAALGLTLTPSPALARFTGAQLASSPAKTAQPRARSVRPRARLRWVARTKPIKPNQRLRSTKANAVRAARVLREMNFRPGVLDSSMPYTTEIKVGANVTVIDPVLSADYLRVEFQTKRGKTVRYVNNPTLRYLGTQVYLGKRAAKGHISKDYWPD